MSDETRVEWRDWGSAAFAEADARDRPVLLSLSAAWCADCREMDANTYAEPRIAANLNDGFVPVRVDADRRPRVRERYNAGGFPTTALLTPEGTLLAGAGYLDVGEMRRALESVRTTWTDEGREAGRVPRALAADLPPRGELTGAVESHLAGQLEATYDDTHAGWGTEAKFPLPHAVEFALKRDRDRALRTLDAVRDHLADGVAGGFFRYAGTRDWSDIAYEKPIDTTAAVTRAFANAYLYTGEEAYLDPALDAVGFLTDDLWTGEGVGGSLGPGLGRAYYAAPAAERADRDPPRRDPTVFAGGNALAADALLAVAAYTDDKHAREYADRILDGLERDLIDAETGVVTRYRDGGEAGPSDLLEDAARVVGAFVRAAGVRGEGVEVARAVADRAIDRLRVDGSFVDGPRSGPGLLDRPFRPLDANAEMAAALCDLAALTGADCYREIARETAAAFAGAAERLSVQVAGYGSLVGRLRRGTTVIAVGTEPGSDLHRAAWRVADHEKVVAPNAHADDAPAPRPVPEGTAVVLAGDAASEPAETPAELLERVADVLG